MASGVVGGEVLSFNHKSKNVTVETISQEVEMQKARLKKLEQRFNSENNDQPSEKRLTIGRNPTTYWSYV